MTEISRSWGYSGFTRYFSSCFCDGNFGSEIFHFQDQTEIDGCNDRY